MSQILDGKDIAWGHSYLIDLTKLQLSPPVFFDDVRTKTLATLALRDFFPHKFPCTQIVIAATGNPGSFFIIRTLIFLSGIFLSASFMKAEKISGGRQYGGKLSNLHF
jgi:hypothetical protein